MEKGKELKVIPDSFEVHGKTYHVEWHDSDDFKNIDSDEVEQVYGLCFNEDGKVAMVKYAKDKPNLPGGKVEEGEDWQEAFKREIEEEINMKVEDFLPVGYQIPLDEELKNKRRKYALRVVAKIKELDEKTPDPAGTVIGHEFVEPEELNKYIQYGPVGDHMIERAQKRLNEIR